MLTVINDVYFKCPVEGAVMVALEEGLFISNVWLDGGWMGVAWQGQLNVGDLVVLGAQFPPKFKLPPMWLRLWGGSGF